MSDHRALPAVLDRLPPGWQAKPAATVERLYSLVVGGNGDGRIQRLSVLYGNVGMLARTRRLGEALDAFGADVELYVAERAPRHVFVHAGVVGWRGRAIVVPGRSFSGKTTLVEELVRAGATYYSDEYAVFDAQGRVQPFPRPLSVRHDGRHVQERRSAESLGGVIGERPLPVGLVALTEYNPRVLGWRPRRLSAGQGVLKLFAHAVAARRRPTAVLAALERATADALTLEGRRGEAERAAATILKRAS